MAERGRPRGFDTNDALDRAVEVFWRRGYEGASLTELTDAMSINRPSLYAAFGGKEELFRTAVGRYVETDMAYVRDALDRPTAYEVAEMFLTENAKALTRDDRPAGCLSIQGGLSCGADNGSIADFLAASRLAGEQAMVDRLRTAAAGGELAEGTDPAALARFLMAISEGHAVHAAAGIGRAALLASVAIALLAVRASTVVPAPAAA